MAYRVLLSREGDFARMEFSGEVRGADPAAAIRALYRHPRWVIGGMLLVDARHVEAITTSMPDLPLIKAALYEVSAYREGGRTAVLLQPDTAARLWHRIPELGPRVGRNVAFFQDLEAALAFLGRSAVPPVMSLVSGTPPSAPGAEGNRSRA